MFPLFVWNILVFMSVEQKIREVLEEKFSSEDFRDCFLVDVFQKKSKLEVFVDSDSGMTFEKCKKISRSLENYLDEHDLIKEAYTLEVSSPGIDSPLKFPRQFSKNIGRQIEVIDLGGNKIDAILDKVDDNGIVVSYEKIIKEGNKKKKLIEEVVFSFDDIKKAVIKVTF